MGCNVSTLDSHQDPNFLSRIRPLFFHRLGEIKARRNLGSPLKDSTPSKKELLSNIDDEIGNSHRLLLSPDPSKPKADSIQGKDETPKGKGATGLVKIKTKEDESRVEDDHFADAVDELQGDDDSDDDRNKRMIGYQGEEAFPGSPSFRVYFKDNEVEEGLDVVIDNKDDEPKETSKFQESSAKEKLEKTKKKRSFRHVLPKNLLNVKSCYTPSHHSHHNIHHCLAVGKKTT